MFVRSPFAVFAQLPIVAVAVATLAVGSIDVATLVADTAADRFAALSPSDAWDTFSAELTIHRHLVAPDNTPAAQAPTVRYRWTRSKHRGGWRSVVDIPDITAPVVRTIKGVALLDRPPSVARIEDDEDGTPVRVFDRRGRAMRLPSVDDRRVLGEPVEGSLRVPALPEIAYPDAKRANSASRDWVDAFIAVPDRKTIRLDSLRRRFGGAVGRVRNLDRFVVSDAEQTIEVLADRTTAVPVEINVAHDQRLVGHSTVTYGAGPGGALVRQAVRTEQRLSSPSASRAVAQVEIAQVRLERRGER